MPFLQFFSLILVLQDIFSSWYTDDGARAGCSNRSGTANDYYTCRTMLGQTKRKDNSLQLISATECRFRS
jgi:hypothetical protein